MTIRINPFVFFETFILIIWFHSSIVDTLSKVKLFARLFRYDKYIKHKANIDVFSSYPEFLGVNHPNWIGKLANCTICLTFWMTLATTILSGSGFFAFFEIYILTFIIYSLIKKIMP
jgi:hypothetical protein